MSAAVDVEHEWDEILASLDPWDWHTLQRHELDWHDAWVDGLLDRTEIGFLIRLEQGLKETA